jgi:Golgi nucleoside diphosphatase
MVLPVRQRAHRYSSCYRRRGQPDREKSDSRFKFICQKSRFKLKKSWSEISLFYKLEAAPEYIIPLLRFAADHIPEERRRETPVFIFATAGMRLLSAE